MPPSLVLFCSRLIYQNDIYHFDILSIISASLSITKNQKSIRSIYSQYPIPPISAVSRWLLIIVFYSSGILPYLVNCIDSHLRFLPWSQYDAIKVWHYQLFALKFQISYHYLQFQCSISLAIRSITCEIAHLSHP